MTNEQWRPVIGHPKYEVSNLGRFRHRERKLIRKTKDYSGYGHQSVTVYAKGRIVHLKVHQAVLAAFVGPRPPGYATRHLDGNPANNRLENLCYGTMQANSDDCVRHGRSGAGELHHNARLTTAQVLAIRGARGQKTRRQLATEYGVTTRTIKAIWAGTIWKLLIKETV